MNANDVENLHQYVDSQVEKISTAMNLVADAMAGMIAMSHHLAEQVQPSEWEIQEVPD